MKKSIYGLIFLITLIILSAIYNYQRQLFLRPSGHHQWRQCDGAAIARNYHYVSMNFFEPRLSVLTGNDGKMAGEFPLLYYLAACFYQIFGYNEFILRLLTLLTFFTGLFYLYKASFLLLKDHFYALLCGLLPFTSAVTIFYANNFLPDVPALALTFIAYYYFLRFTNSNNKAHLFLSITMFSLAAVLKISALIGLVAILIIAFFKHTTTNARQRPSLKEAFSTLALLLTPFIVFAIWLLWTKHYNDVNDNHYFLNTIRPIWVSEEKRRLFIYDRFRFDYLRQLFYREFVNIIPWLTIALFFIPAKNNRKLVAWYTLTLFGALAYVILFYDQFIVHDYYLICIVVVPVALCIVLLTSLRTWLPIVFRSLVTKTGFFVFFCICVYHGQRILPEKFFDEDFSSFNDVEPYLNKIGVGINDKIVVWGDKSTGITLYLANRRGWTDYLHQSEKENIPSLKEMGARYFLTMPQKNIPNEEMEKWGLRKKIGEHKGINIYSLK